MSNSKSDQAQQAYRLRSDGLTNRQIADKLSINASQLAYLFANLGMQNGKAVPRSELKERDQPTNLKIYNEWMARVGLKVKPKRSYALL